jgi:glycosyltransferase involved in cell wall biosynthesis
MQGKKVLVITSYRKDPYKVGTNYYIEHFAKNNQVVRLSFPFSLFSLLEWKWKDIQYCFRNWLKRGERQKGVIDYIPLFLFQPIRKLKLFSYLWAMKYYKYFTWPKITAWLDKIGFGQIDVLFLDISYGITLFDLLAQRSKLTVYRVNDLFAGFNVPQGVTAYEDEMLNRVDIALPVSKPLYENVVARRGSGKGVYLLPNGVDLSLYQANQPVPTEYAAIPLPRVIYAGWLSHWFDWDLMIHCAKMLPHYSFVILGKGDKPDGIPGNMYLLGQRRPAQLPAYLQHASVGIIPFKDEPAVRMMEKPLKYYEYLAAGLPVVSVNHGALKAMSENAFLAGDKEEFVDCLKKAAERSLSEGYKQAQRNKAAEYGWSEIFTRFENILAENGIRG